MEASDSHEPSYYEIALTNRQVVVAFVILLVCLLCAFFSGVWIGRESTLRTQGQVARNGAAVQPEADKEGQALEEFEFFDDSRKPAQPGADADAGDAGETEPPAPSAQDTTLAEDLGGAPEARPAQPQAPVPSVPAPATTEPEEEPARPEPERRQERAETPVRPRPLPEAEPAAARSGVVIQVFSSPERNQAEKIRDQLVAGGHKAFLSPVEVAGRTMYRVRIGPFEARDRAQKVAEQVRKTFKLDTWVTE